MFYHFHPVIGREREKSIARASQKLLCRILSPMTKRNETSNHGAIHSSPQETAMRIAYLTTDEVNRDLAHKFATECDVNIRALSPRETPQTGSFDGVVYDVDFLPEP